MAIRLSLTIICLFMSFGYADSESTQAADSQQYIYCPKVESLVRDDVSGKWSAPGGWFSVKYSFAKQINDYLGASYHGDDIGRIECYYTSHDTGDARIILKNTKLTQIPKLDVWKDSEKDKKVKVCKMNNSVGCPFILYQEKQHLESLEDAILNMPK